MKKTADFLVQRGIYDVNRNRFVEGASVYIYTTDTAIRNRQAVASFESGSFMRVTGLKIKTGETKVVNLKEVL